VALVSSWLVVVAVETMQVSDGNEDGKSTGSDGDGSSSRCRGRRLCDNVITSHSNCPNTVPVCINEGMKA
jgi:hypothetical protein